MISLGLRLAVKGGREASARLVFTAIGVALGVALLCFTLAGFNGLKAKDVREGWYTTSAENRQPSVDESTSDPLWWSLTSDRFAGDVMLRLEVAATGPDSPAAPGLSSVPAPGEYYVSPALADLLAETPADQLADRFPGRQAGIIADEALSSPDSLVVIIGRTTDQVRRLPSAMAVRSIEAAPREHSYSSFLKIVLSIGAAGLLIPVLVFVATSTRLAAARREERFAALRLVGATPGQVNAIASVEAFVGAFAGALIGFALFWAFRPLVARIPLTGEPFFTVDLSLGWIAILGIGLGVPVAAAAVSLLSLRRVRISPLGVTRHVTPKPPRARRLALLIASLGVLAASRFWEGEGVVAQWLITGCFAGVAIGLMLAGPWLTLVGARLLARVARRDTTLIAGRRLADDPGRAFRAISGLILAVFVGTVFVGVVGTVIARQDVLNPATLDADVMAADVSDAGANGLSAERATALAADLRDVEGVRGVVFVRHVPGSKGSSGLVAVEDWGLLGKDVEVAGGAPAVKVNTSDLLYGDPVTDAASADTVPSGGLTALPAGVLLALTDGSRAAIETTRTAIEVAVPEAPPPITIAEFDEEGWAMVTILQRLVDVGIILSLIIAGCSLAVSVAGSLIERKRPFSLLRLTGMPLSHLRRIVLLEALVPLSLAAVLSIASGLFAADLILQAVSRDVSLALPGADYWAIVGGGLAGALVVVIATMPLLARVTELHTARME